MSYLDALKEAILGKEPAKPSNTLNSTPDLPYADPDYAYDPKGNTYTFAAEGHNRHQNAEWNARIGQDVGNEHVHRLMNPPAHVTDNQRNYGEPTMDHAAVTHSPVHAAPAVYAPHSQTADDFAESVNPGRNMPDHPHPTNKKYNALIQALKALGGVEERG